jgi:hypothetical protein
MAGLAVVLGAIAFLTGASLLFNIPSASEGSAQEKLFRLNGVVGTGVLFLVIGAILVIDAASALGNTSSSPVRIRRMWLWVFAPAFPVLIGAGQLMADHPETLPWVFPLVNIAMVSIPSLLIAAIAVRRYTIGNPLAWPVSWREWTSGLAYGAVGATTVAAIINVLTLFGLGALLVTNFGRGGIFPLEDSLTTLPRGWGIFLDVTVLSVAGPLNEEFWKGLLVALFFFRRGNLARCFLWGVLAGTGFNLLETFQNSLGAVSPEALADQTIGSAWWFFACARAGTAAMHGLASGMAAIGFYGLLRRKPKYLLGYPAGVLLHGTWNFLVYAIWGEAMFSRAWRGSTALDVAGGAGLLLVFLGSVAMLWLLTSRLRDEAPAHLYRALGMVPASPPGPPG